ncbi:uncharacterized protein FIBRA_00708 [Fibroporia radiculosa]|uniref:Peptidase A1 domain-containing protein n=1 Tax=Fibroporia radiculosa TaxID=599839 RepID=J4H0I7_9APHY|nr:uncharacterized protein FIBRA_00708 [Fibroporia radiculosa]CCL98704.1 predicted protein [Fibroporia radiculosa]
MRRCVPLSFAFTLFLSGANTLTVVDLKRARNGSIKDIVDADHARAAFLGSVGSERPTTISTTQYAYEAYLASVGVGNPPTYYNLIVDTGSSNTWVGANVPYVKTSTSIPTGEAVNVTYGSGNFTGYEYYDEVTIASGLVIKNQSIADATEYAGFYGVDGIIGFGPTDLTLTSLTDYPDKTIPTVMNNAYAQGIIPEQVLGVSFAPPSSNDSTNGKLTLGGIDDSLYIGPLLWTPVTQTAFASHYWGVNISVMYGFEAFTPASLAGIVDTGTTLIYFWDSWYELYTQSIPGSFYDATYTGLTAIPESEVPFMQPITVLVSGQPLLFDAAAQLVPPDEVEGGQAGYRYSFILPLGDVPIPGFQFVLGLKFMERFYAVFDTDHSRVGFGYTEHTFSQTGL